MTSTLQTMAPAMSARGLTKTYGVGDTQVVAVGGVDLELDRSHEGMIDRRRYE